MDLQSSAVPGQTSLPSRCRPRPRSQAGRLCHPPVTCWTHPDLLCGFVALAPEQQTRREDQGESSRSQGGGTGVPPVTGDAAGTGRAERSAQGRRWTGDPYDRLGPVPGGLRMTHRNLPHFQRGGAIYFVTFRLASGELSPRERQTVMDGCRHWDGEKMELHAAVVMPDHVHLIVSPFFVEPGRWHSLSELLHSIKSFTSHEVGEMRGVGGQVWQDESFDRIIRGWGEFAQKRHYVAQNPVRKGLAKEWREYAFTWMPEETLAGCYRFVERVFDRRPGERVPRGDQGDQLRGPSSGHRRDACATPLIFMEEEEGQGGGGALRVH